MEVFLAEDNYQLSKALITFFNMKSFSVTHFDDGEDAFDNILTNRLKDVYIIDINLPNINGLELVKQIRRLDKNVPIIMITASVDIDDFEHAYDFGCSDYIKKPFNLKELDIRLTKLLKKDRSVIELSGGIKFDIELKKLFFNDKEIELRKKELRFLTLLFSNQKQKVLTEEFEEFVWEGELKESYPLRQLVNGLRRKLPFDFIKTEIGIGYSINENCR
ncbi:MAG: response regulator transcription factor [Campylobacterales bacterium]|nr:response regulator transcription factor [Campylobacterales bacterium]